MVKVFSLFLISLSLVISYRISVNCNRQFRRFMSDEDNDDFDFFEIVEPGKYSIPVEQPETSNKSIFAALSVLVGIGIGSFQHFSTPSSVLGLLHLMEAESVSVNQAMCSNKPTLVEFYADWCEICKKSAPTVRALKYKYKDKINFITVDAVKDGNEEIVTNFRVDGIPHFAFLNSKSEVETSLVGAVPEKILDEEMAALAKGNELPYIGYDAFQNRDRQPLKPTITCN